MHISFVPLEILLPWICKKNSCTCKSWLQIWYNTITSLKYISNSTLKPIKNFKNLQHLKIDLDNVILDDSAKYLKKVTKLQSLEFYSDDLTDNILKSLKNLTSLLYASEHVTDKSLKRLTKLKSLSLRQGDRISHDSLKHLTNLTSITLDGNTRSIIPTLANLPYLIDLWMSDNNITNNMLKNFTNLTKLSISRCPKLFDEGIKKLTNIADLTLIDMDYISYRSLKELKNLIRLEICNCDRIYDNTIQRLTQLQHFESYSDSLQIEMSGARYLTNLKH
jgi:hypothetical protein